MEQLCVYTTLSLEDADDEANLCPGKGYPGLWAGPGLVVPGHRAGSRTSYGVCAQKSSTGAGQVGLTEMGP
jgi:hypothetical protein